MRPRLLALACLMLPGAAPAQPPGKFPPDSLVNVKVFPRSTPVLQVIGAMRNFTGYLGVRCQYCHQGEEGLPLDRFDFPSDAKRTKLVARQMMQMVAEINRRLDTIPGRTAGAGLQVTCGTCHRGVTRPVPLSTLLEETALASGVDSAVRAYRSLRKQYYGSDAYDFEETSLNSAALRLARVNKFADAFALLDLNETFFPQSSRLYVYRGAVSLLQADTLAAVRAYREAIRRDSTNEEAKFLLRGIGQRP